MYVSFILNLFSNEYIYWSVKFPNITFYLVVSDIDFSWGLGTKRILLDIT